MSEMHTPIKLSHSRTYQQSIDDTDRTTYRTNQSQKTRQLSLLRDRVAAFLTRCFCCYVMTNGVNKNSMSETFAFVKLSHNQPRSQSFDDTLPPTTTYHAPNPTPKPLKMQETQKNKAFW